MQFWLCLIDIFYFFIFRDIQSDYHQHLTRWLIYVSCALNFVALKCWENCRTYINSLLNWTPAFTYFQPTRLAMIFFLYVFLSHFKTKKIESVYFHQQTIGTLFILWWGQRNPASTTYTRAIIQVKWEDKNLIVARGMLKPVHFAFVETMLEFFCFCFCFCFFQCKLPILQPGSRGPSSKYLRWNKPVDIKSSFSSALRASLTRLGREPSVSIRKKYIWNPGYTSC